MKVECAPSILTKKCPFSRKTQYFKVTLLFVELYSAGFIKTLQILKALVVNILYILETAGFQKVFECLGGKNVTQISFVKLLGLQKREMT